jgi:hypothetical protein
VLSAGNALPFVTEFHELNGAGYDLGLSGFSADELDALLAPIGDGSDTTARASSCLAAST